MHYCFDIDGTICNNTNGKYAEAVPRPSVIARVNELFEAGHTIKLFTARGSTSGLDWRELTESQLAEWDVHYHELIMGKPHADIYVDDKSIHPVDWMSDRNMPSEKVLD